MFIGKVTPSPTGDVQRTGLERRSQKVGEYVPQASQRCWSRGVLATRCRQVSQSVVCASLRMTGHLSSVSKNEWPQRSSERVGLGRSSSKTGAIMSVETRKESKAIKPVPYMQGLCQGRQVTWLLVAQDYRILYSRRKSRAGGEKDRDKTIYISMTRIGCNLGHILLRIANKAKTTV